MYLFEKRLGCLSDDNKESEEYIAAVQDVMHISAKLVRSPLWSIKLFMRADLKKHDDAWDVIMRKGRNLIQKIIFTRLIQIDLKASSHIFGFASMSTPNFG